MHFKLNLWIKEEPGLHLETRRIREFCTPEPFSLVWDERCPTDLTLSYTRFLVSPDVFRGEFIIIYTWTHDSRGERG